MGVFWFFVGLLTLDFNIAGFSPKQVLFFNAVWFLLVCGAFFFPLFWYRLIFGDRFFLLEEKRQIQDKLDAINDDIVYKNNLKMGVSPPNRLEVSCLGLLFSFLLFDIFYRGGMGERPTCPSLATCLGGWVYSVGCK